LARRRCIDATALSSSTSSGRRENRKATGCKLIERLQAGRDAVCRTCEHLAAATGHLWHGPGGRRHRQRSRRTCTSVRAFCGGTSCTNCLIIYIAEGLKPGLHPPIDDSCFSPTNPAIVVLGRAHAVARFELRLVAVCAAAHRLISAICLTNEQAGRACASSGARTGNRAAFCDGMRGFAVLTGLRANKATSRRVTNWTRRHTRRVLERRSTARAGYGSRALDRWACSVADVCNRPRLRRGRRPRRLTA